MRINAQKAKIIPRCGGKLDIVMADILDELKNAGFDTVSALPRFCDNRELYLKYILKFPEERYLPDYKAEFDAGNYDRAAEIIHDFKGVSGNLGATRLFQIASDIMTMFRHSGTEGIAPLNDGLYAEFERVSEAIKKCR